MYVLITVSLELSYLYKILKRTITQSLLCVQGQLTNINNGWAQSGSSLIKKFPILHIARATSEAGAVA